ncbi:MAG: hypothetical protein DDG59_08825 [Anaerolineae bacterium]|nr:MAG: hypothetical protein DDG59_08825 [Anaerolineae bacterium]
MIRGILPQKFSLGLCFPKMRRVEFTLSHLAGKDGCLPGMLQSAAATEQVESSSVGKGVFVQLA